MAGKIHYKGKINYICNIIINSVSYFFITGVNRAEEAADSLRVSAVTGINFGCPPEVPLLQIKGD